MNNRERIINTVLNRPVDRLPYFCFFGPWGETIEKWKDEGLVGDWCDGLDFDEGIAVINVNLGYHPPYEYEYISEDERTITTRNEQGIVTRSMKRGSTIPEYLEYPVCDRASWELLKKRLDPDDYSRFPPDWEERTAELNGGDALNQLGTYPYGLFGTLRDMFGVEKLLFMTYDDRELIKEIMNYLTDFWIAIWERAAKDVRVDAIHMWEDMSGVSGSLISPAMIRELMVPCYKKMKDFCVRRGVPVFSLDTDGDVKLIAEVFIEAGINLLFPFEVQASGDVCEYLTRYPTLCCLGGIDKRALAAGKDAIDSELERVMPSFKTGHYIPQLDHLIHPEVPYENFVYFCNKLKTMCGKK